MTATPTAAAAATTTSALTTVELLGATGPCSGALGFGWSRTLRAPLLTLDGTLRSLLAAPGGTLRPALLALDGALRSLLAASGGALRPLLAAPGRSFRPLLPTPALIAPVVRPIAPLAGPAATFPRAPRGCSTFTIAPATPGSAVAPLVGIREGGAAGAPHHPHPVGPRPDAEESARALFEDGDHHFGAGETQRFQALRHRRIQRPAFENVALVGHQSPQSCASRPGGKANPGMPALALLAGTIHDPLLRTRIVPAGEP